MLHTDRLRTRKTLLLLGLFGLSFATPAFAGGNTAPAAAKPTKDVATFEIYTGDAEAIAYNAHSNRVWIYGNRRLQALLPDGSRVVDRHLPQLPQHQPVVELLAENDRIWLAIGRVLYEFDRHGQITKHRGFRDAINAIHYDVKRGQLLVATADYVVVLDQNGHEIERIHTRLANIA